MAQKNKSEKNSEKKQGSENFIVITLNDKIMPNERGEFYEDPLDDFLRAKNYGEITGGGTFQLESGEVDGCDIEIKLSSDKVDDSVLQEIISKVEELGAPKGSKLHVEKNEKTISFGKKEGLAVYLDGVSLDKEVYEKCDVNYVIAQLKKLTADNSEFIRYWEGNETGLFFYAESFDEMKEAVAEFIESYPLCENARVERIA